MLKHAIAPHLQHFLNESRYLNPFQSFFSPEPGVEIASINLADNLQIPMASENVSIDHPWFSAFNTIDHDILVNI